MRHARMLRPLMTLLVLVTSQLCVGGASVFGDAVYAPERRDVVYLHQTPVLFLPALTAAESR